MIIAGRRVNGVTINPLEYPLDDDDETIEFVNKDAAIKFLLQMTIFSGLSLKL